MQNVSTVLSKIVGWNVCWLSTDASTATQSISFRLIVDVSANSVGDLSVKCRSTIGQLLVNYRWCFIVLVGTVTLVVAGGFKMIPSQILFALFMPTYPY